MDTQTRTEYDAITGECEIIPLTADEIAERESLATAQAEAKAQAEADKASATAILKALGLTEAEAKVVIGLE